MGNIDVGLTTNRNPVPVEPYRNRNVPQDPILILAARLLCSLSDDKQGVMLETSHPIC